MVTVANEGLKNDKVSLDVIKGSPTSLRTISTRRLLEMQKS